MAERAGGVKLSLACEHGTWTVEVEDGREGLGADNYVANRVRVLMPLCPYCSIPWAGRVAVHEGEQPRDPRTGEPM